MSVSTTKPKRKTIGLAHSVDGGVFWGEVRTVNETQRADDGMNRS
jgi:hypothetical protein